MPQKVAGNFHHQYDVTSTNCITKPYYQHRNHESQCGQQRILRGQWSLRRRRMTISYFSTASNSCVPVSALQMRAAVLPFRGLIDQSPAPPHLLGRRSPASTYFVGTYNHKRRKAPTAAAAAAEGDPDLPRGPLSSSLLQVQRHIIHAPHALLVSCPLMRHILPSPDQPARRMCMAPAAPHASINTCRLMALGLSPSPPLATRPGRRSAPLVRPHTGTPTASEARASAASPSPRSTPATATISHPAAACSGSHALSLEWPRAWGALSHAA